MKNQVERLKLSFESAQLLRDFAEAMPIAISNIVESTEKLGEVYQTVADEVGPHATEIFDILMLIKGAQEETTELLQVLPIKLNDTADKIEEFCRKYNHLLGK